MHTVENCFHVDSDVITLEALKNKYLAISSTSSKVSINSSQNFETKLIIESELLTSDLKVISFSPDGTLLAFSTNSNIYVIEIRFNKLLNTIPIENNQVDILTFDPTSQYLIVGTKLGRVFQYKYDNPSLLSRVCSFPFDWSNLPREFQNYVSVITFFGSKIACSGYGGAIFVMDMHINTYRDVVEPSSHRSEALCFIDRDNLISGNEAGELYFISLENEIKFEKLQTPFECIKSITKIPNTTYAFITSKQKSLAIIDYDAKKLVNECYANFHDEISHICLLDENTIVLALKNGDILKLNLPTPEQLDEITQYYPLPKVLKLTQNSTIMKNFKNYQKLEKKYEHIYNLATKALMQNDKKMAIKLLKDFTQVSSKQLQIKELFETFKHYESFKSAIRFKKYNQAYLLSDKYELLTQTQEYKIMENEWQERFLNAQKSLMGGDINHAKQLLFSYKNIPSKKEFCSFIYTYHKEFLSFLKALTKKDFSVMDEIAEKHQDFQKIPTYINLKNRINGSLKLIDNCILKANTELARTHITKLQNIPHIKKELRELELKNYNVNLLKEAYDRKDLLACYKLLDTKRYLHHIILGQALEKHWAKLVSKAESYALLGDVKSVKLTLKSVINIESRKSKLGDLLRVAYHTRIKKLIDAKDIKHSYEVIHNYLKIFGIDFEIKDIIKLFEDMFSKKLNYEDKGYQSGVRDNWRISIDSI